MSERLRLLVYDRTCRGRPGLPGLSHAWQAGAGLYRGLRRLDGVLGAESWQEALAWLATEGADRPVAEVQFWGHGKWGEARIGQQILDRSSFAPGGEHRAAFEALRSRLVPDALFWFRTCETFGARPGQDFARALTDFLGCRTAGHTFVIGFHQSGLHTLAPGAEPNWALDEGLAAGSVDEPLRALPSRPWAINTITCLHGAIPRGY